MSFSKIIAVCCENHTKYINTQSAGKVQSLIMVKKLVAHSVTVILLMVIHVYKTYGN